jgi:hypothetical protein
MNPFNQKHKAINIRKEIRDMFRTKKTGDSFQIDLDYFGKNIIHMRAIMHDALKTSGIGYKTSKDELGGLWVLITDKKA